MIGDIDVSESHDRGRELILAAFDSARESGKPDWRTMRTSVLKNRLLRLTDGAFHESEWGAPTVVAFVDQFPDIVGVDRTTHPAIVQLKADVHPDSEAAAPSLSPLGPRRSLRPDLWRAVLNFRGGHQYVLDDGIAVPLETPAAPDDPRPILPTVSEDDFDGWRAAFVSAQEGSSPSVRAALDAWNEQRLGTQALPPRFRNLWTAELKRNVLERLTDWFESQKLAIPDDLVEERALKSAQESDVSSLRALVIRCVAAMTQEELERLPIPARVIARVRP
jgi:hypothetical protein